MTNNNINREAWLIAAVEALAPVFAEAGETLPAVKVSVGWPGGSGRKNSVIGQCWSPSAAADQVSHIFISPVLDEAPRVLDVLAHELVHAINYAEGDDCGHRGRFATIARAIGLTGKMTATVAGEELAERLGAIADDLGDYPHGAIVNPLDGVKKQTTRMLKIECAEGSGYIVRTTRKWLEEFGAPKCPCHDETMAQA